MRHTSENKFQDINCDIALEFNIKKAAALIKSASYVIVLTGAGSSTPSGIPDFRSPGSGLWTRYSPSEFGSLTSFRYHPEKFFNWLRPLANLMIDAEPNPTHTALTNLEHQGIVRAVITQNIDCLHQKAGSKVVIEVHGSMNTLSCTGCFKQSSSDQHIQSYIEDGTIPHCPHCNRILKPDVVLFEEQLPKKAWLLAKSETKKCDLMLVAGSSLTVTPACELPLLALNNGAKLIVINLEPTYIDNYSDVVIHNDVSFILPSIASKVIR